MQKINQKNKKASIPLVALLSLVLGAAVLLAFAIKVASVLDSDDNTWKYHYLRDFTILMSETKENAASSKSLSLGPKDLFLFFDTGIEPIELKSSAKASKDFVFKRPTDCNGKACICYCQGNAYWESIQDDPGLKLSSLRPEKEFECSQPLDCEYYQDDRIFANSRGSKEYAKMIVTTLNHDKDNYIYTPITLDIPTILQFELDENVFFVDYKEIKEDQTMDTWLNPFGAIANAYTNYNAKRNLYTSYFQIGYIETLIEEYKWKGGYVLGAYGAAETDENRDNHELRVPPVTLRIENKGDGVYGVCIHSKCLFEDDVTKLKENIKKKKYVIMLAKEFSGLKSNLVQAQTCYDTKTDDVRSTACMRYIVLSDIFAPDMIENIHPKLTFTYENGATTIQLEEDLETEFEPLSTGLAFSCTKDQKITESFTLHGKGLNLNEYWLHPTDFSTCFMSMVPKPENQDEPTATN